MLAKASMACSTVLSWRSRRIAMPPQLRINAPKGQRKMLCLPNQRAFRRSTNFSAIKITKSQLEVWWAPMATNLSSFGNCPSIRQPISFSTLRPSHSAAGLRGR